MDIVKKLTNLKYHMKVAPKALIGTGLLVGIQAFVVNPHLVPIIQGFAPTMIEAVPLQATLPMGIGLFVGMYLLNVAQDLLNKK